MYLHDAKHKVNFIFSPEGKFIKAFGEKGEGPSEIRNQRKMHIVNNTLMISDANRIHYFTLDGTYVKSVIKSNLSRRRNLFIDENQMVSAPLFKVDNPDGIGIYCSHIALQGNVKMYRPSTLVIQDNYLYLRLEGEEGEMMIGKYRVNLPTLSP